MRWDGKKCDGNCAEESKRKKTVGSEVGKFARFICASSEMRRWLVVATGRGSIGESMEASMETL